MPVRASEGGMMQYDQPVPERDPSLKSCHHVKDAYGDWVHIPGCWGAIHDTAGCTCAITGSALEQAQAGRREAERYIEKLLDRADERVERLNNSFNYQRHLHARMREAEAQRDTATKLLHEVMMQIVARPDIAALCGPAETQLWDRARTFWQAATDP